MARRAVGGFCSAWSLGSAASGRSSSAAASKGHKDRTVSAPTLSHGRRQWRDHGRAGARRERRRMTLILLVVATLLVTTSLLCFRKRALRQRRAPPTDWRVRLWRDLPQAGLVPVSLRPLYQRPTDQLPPPTPILC